MTKKKYVLFGVGEKAYYILRSLNDHKLRSLSFVVLGRDRGVENDFSEEMRDFCDNNKILCHERLKGDPYLDTHDGLTIVIGWRWRVSNCKELIVFHDSLLPKYRGFAPVVSALINGDKQLGATALYAVDKYDCGPIIAQRSREIKYPIKVSEAIQFMSEMYKDMFHEILNKYIEDHGIEGIPQDNSMATYSLWRDELDYFIDWSRDAKEIERFIDAVGYPYAGAKCSIAGKVVRLNSVRALADQVITCRESAIGKVIDSDENGPVVVCGSGLLKVMDGEYEDGSQLLPLKKFRTRFA